jgi:dienelactone hydrolase
MMNAACVSDVLRLSNSSRMMKMVPQLEESQVKTAEYAGNRHGRFDAVSVQGDLLELVHRFPGPLHRGGGGHHDIDHEVALVLLGDEAGRRCRHPHIGQAEQAGVQDQDDDAYSNGWITNYNALGQVAAAKGIAVFYPNYRGSTGYGVEFSMKGQKDAGGKEFDDLIDGVDHLIKMGLVDEKKVGITGGSYGGYATAWGATYYSHRFAAGVMFVGISDWISCSGTTDIPQEMFLVHHRKWLWDDWEYFKKASPIAHLDKAKTPLLILHGKNDPRVNPGQSLELYRHLKVRNQAPVRLVLYPGEGHGNRRAASKLDYNIRCLQWMEHYLKGPGGAMPAMEIDYRLTPAEKKTASWNERGEPSRVNGRVEAWLGRGYPCCIGW